jgi:hypothetical protein
MATGNITKINPLWDVSCLVSMLVIPTDYRTGIKEISPAAAEAE